LQFPSEACIFALLQFLFPCHFIILLQPMRHISDWQKFAAAAFFLVFTCTLSPFFLRAQETPQAPTQASDNPLGLAKQPRQTFLTFGGVLGAITQQDAVHSPLRYSGIATGLSGDLRAYSPNTYLHIGSNLAVGTLFPATGKERNLNAAISAIQTNTFAALAFDVLHSEDRTMRLYAGGLLNVMANIKTNVVFGNSATAFDVYASLGAMARAEQDFTLWGKQWRGTSQIMLPLGGVAVRPYYSTVLTSTAALGSSDLFSSFDIQGASIFNFPQILWRTSLDYMLSTGNWLSLAYEWDFYDYNRFNRVQAARQAVSLSLHFRLE
jgi:hypothetical protein